MIKNIIRNERHADPAVGSLWKFRDHPPWPRRDYFATVTDVKSGWVRYKIGSGEIYSDWWLRLDKFLICYEPAEPSTEQRNNKNSIGV